MTTRHKMPLTAGQVLVLALFLAVAGLSGAMPQVVVLEDRQLIEKSNQTRAEGHFDEQGRFHCPLVPQLV